MRLLLSILLVVIVVTNADQASFDCPMRQLLLNYAYKIQPFRTKEHFNQIADALNGSPEANHCNVAPIEGWEYGERVPSFQPEAQSFYVDTIKGKDTNNGSITDPFQTIQRALQATRAGSGPGAIVLRAGTFYLSQTISLGPQDNSLVIQNYPGEEVWISGGVPINPNWKAYDLQTTVKVFDNLNNVFGRAAYKADTATIKYLGEFNTTDQCQNACLQYNKNGLQCNSYTFHSPQLNNEYARLCYAVVDNYFQPVVQNNVNSGYVKRANIYVADLSQYKFSSIPGLRINGQRSIRARYPNANPETQGFGSTQTANSWLPPTLPSNPDIEFNPDTPLRTTSNSFQKYQLGVGGPCKNFDPPAGYWCGNRTEGGGAYTYKIPTGMVANQVILPNSPYKNAVGAVVQAWRPAHWASWMFEVGSYNPQSSTFVFSKGGFQGARGENSGEDFYIENVFEELDSPNEWYFDANTNSLYLWYNGTGAPPANTQFVAVQQKVLLTITGSQAQPVQSVQILGVNFRDTAYTYMDPHSMPSGGDWALQRSGAVILQGTESVQIANSVFERLDGNALLISEYNRYATVRECEFSWIGDTAIASWGNTKGSPIAGMGWDGTDGDQPRFNRILNNFVHELGIWEKQSSFYFQAKSCQNLLQGNIFFNGPRAGINFNDGFGGGSTLSENILFNTCRESGDHGPFNSWDRQVYVTDVLNGSPSTVKQYDYITENFIIANYNSQEAIDNDDGSAFYETWNNFLAYSGNGMKNDFGGHDNHHHDNIYAYIGRGFEISPQLPGHPDFFYHNRLVQNNDGNYGNGQDCSSQSPTVVYGNEVYSPTGKITECGMPIDAWQAKGGDPGTTVSTYPPDSVLLGWIKELFGI